MEVMKKLKMNKKGYSFSGWTEVILMSILMITAVGFIIAGYNSKYSQNNDPSFGLGLAQDANNSFQNFKNYQQTFQTSVNTGSASFTSVVGLTLSTSYDIILASINVFWTFISGNWITKAVVLMRLPVELGLVFQLLYLLSIGFILLRILFRPSRI